MKNRRSDAIEAVVNSSLYNEAFPERFPQVSGEEKWETLALLCEFSLTGILYYLALVIKDLCTKQRFRSKQTVIWILLGGRGSKLFKSVLREKTHERCGKFFADVSGVKSPIKLDFSDDYKEEVAYGLAIGEDEIDKFIKSTYTTLEEPIIGEPVKVKRNGESFDEFRGYKALAKASPPGEWILEDVPCLRRFVNDYQDSFSRNVPFDDLHVKIVTTVQEALKAAGPLASKAVELEKKGIESPLQVSESLFMTGLKKMVDQMINNKQYVKK